VVSPHPAFDPELESALAVLRQTIPTTMTIDMVTAMRGVERVASVTPEMLESMGLESRDVTIPSYDGQDIELTIVQRKGHIGRRPGIYHTHGGGMVVGDPWMGALTTLPAVAKHDAVFVTVDYRLAPEFPDPTPVEDCYAGLVWTAEHAEELGIDLDRLMIAGGSAGGGLAAGCTLLARDRKRPRLCAQMLVYPMLDDRNETVSSVQVDGVGVWDRGSNLMGWTALLGDRRGSDDVSIYAAPARATDLSGLPPTFIDCGTVEVFRDEDVAYASGIWAAGGQAELHVWPGAFHGFHFLAPESQLAREAIAAQQNWLDRILAT
jgi:acetyl esterase/lipase